MSRIYSKWKPHQCLLQHSVTWHLHPHKKKLELGDCAKSEALKEGSVALRFSLNCMRVPGLPGYPGWLSRVVSMAAEQVQTLALLCFTVCIPAKFWFPVQQWGLYG